MRWPDLSSGVGVAVSCPPLPTAFPVGSSFDVDGVGFGEAVSVGPSVGDDDAGLAAGGACVAGVVVVLDVLALALQPLGSSVDAPFGELLAFVVVALFGPFATSEDRWAAGADNIDQRGSDVIRVGCCEFVGVAVLFDKAAVKQEPQWAATGPGRCWSAEQGSAIGESAVVEQCGDGVGPVVENGEDLLCSGSDGTGGVAAWLEW